MTDPRKKYRMAYHDIWEDPRYKDTDQKPPDDGKKPTANNSATSGMGNLDSLNNARKNNYSYNPSNSPLLQSIHWTKPLTCLHCIIAN